MWYLSFCVWLILLNVMPLSCIHFSANGVLSFFFVVEYSIVYLFCSLPEETCSFYSWLPYCCLDHALVHFTGSPLLCLPPLLLCPVVTATINSAMVGSLLCAGICFTWSIMIFNSSYHHNIYTLEMRKLTCREFRVFLHFIPVEDAIRTLISCEKTPNSESLGFLGSFTFSAFLKHSPLPLHAASCREESFSCYFFLGFPVSSLMLISLHFHNISCFNLIYLVLLYSALSTSEAVRIL